MYKNTRFSARSREELLAEIDTMCAMADELRDYSRNFEHGEITSRIVIRNIFRRSDIPESYLSFALWLHRGGKTVFLQDADPLVMKTNDLVPVIATLKARFPSIRRITAYSRSSTTARLGVDKLTQLKQSGLTRVHTGLETGSAVVSEKVCKGATPEQHIRGGLAVRNAGLELSLYIIPGLGGRTFREDHAIETARVVSAIQPDFIRLRTLAVPPGIPLFAEMQAGTFQALTEDEILDEIRLFLSRLAVSRGRLESDHILNLLPDLAGNLPDDLPDLIALIDRVRTLPDTDRMLFYLGRRMGIFRCLDDLGHPGRVSAVREFQLELENNDVDIETALQEIKMRFV